jgi:uncharacterized protein YcnI
VVVTPAQAGVGASVLFTVSVPNERQAAVSSLKLLIPKGVQDAQPDVTAGWDITTAGSSDSVAAITWTGTIPVGRRADFIFKAQVPATAGELDWKAYQTYADGTVVSWDQKPAANAGDDDAAATGPYSVTKVTDDLGSSATTAQPAGSGKAALALVFGIAALVLSIGGLFLRPRRR